MSYNILRRRLKKVLLLSIILSATLLILSELLLGYVIFQKQAVSVTGKLTSTNLTLLKSIGYRLYESRAKPTTTECPSGRIGFVNCGYFDSLLDSPSFGVNFTRSYDDSIQVIEEMLTNYKESIFSFKPNTLDYLMITNPNREIFPDVISLSDSGGRESYGNTKRPECWVFGGSTVWGDRVRNKDSIPSALNRLDSKHNYLNYGVPGFNSNSQLSYLIYLIRERNTFPNCVIWLDGLNDGTFVHLRPIVPAFDRTSHSDRSQNLESSDKQFCIRLNNIPKEIDVIRRTKDARVFMRFLQEERPECQQVLNERLQTWIYSNEYKISERDDILIEASLNQIMNANIAKNIIESNPGSKSRFYWFIQPNGELNRKNPFLNTEHFLTNRYLINLNYQSILVARSHGSSIDLTNLDKDCEYCYIDEAHYSPKFAEEIASRILLAVNS